MQSHGSGRMMSAATRFQTTCLKMPATGQESWQWQGRREGGRGAAASRQRSCRESLRNRPDDGRAGDAGGWSVFVSSASVFCTTRQPLHGMNMACDGQCDHRPHGPCAVPQAPPSPRPRRRRRRCQAGWRPARAGATAPPPKRSACGGQALKRRMPPPSRYSGFQRLGPVDLVADNMPCVAGVHLLRISLNKDAHSLSRASETSPRIDKSSPERSTLPPAPSLSLVSTESMPSFALG